MWCKRCGGIDFTIEYNDDNNLIFWCKDCGHPVIEYHNVKPVVEDNLDSIVITFDYKHREDEDEE